ncbi:MAG TPA: DUF4190 domain-containing protein [Nocardioides sp.]|nr:DUF4190 domain-containing protein [Nocardioides sp.]
MTYPPYGDQPQQPDANQNPYDAHPSPYGQPQQPQQPPADPAPYGQSPYGQAPYGQSPYGQSPYGQAPQDQNPYGQAPYGQSPYGQPYQAPYGYQPAQTTNGLAIASLVVSIISITAFCGLTGIVGAILGHVARKQIRERNQGGAGMALAGIIIGWIGVALVVVFALVMIIAIASDDSSTTYTSGV